MGRVAGRKPSFLSERLIYPGSEDAWRLGAAIANPSLSRARGRNVANKYKRVGEELALGR